VNYLNEQLPRKKRKIIKRIVTLVMPKLRLWKVVFIRRFARAFISSVFTVKRNCLMNMKKIFGNKK